jgi:uncharacterized coiled-coil protein SlyX
MDQSRIGQIIVVSVISSTIAFFGGRLAASHSEIESSIKLVDEANAKVVESRKEMERSQKHILSLHEALTYHNTKLIDALEDKMMYRAMLLMLETHGELQIIYDKCDDPDNAQEKGG